MFIVVIGGSGSGKSTYAEELLSGIEKEKYYLATMSAAGEENQKKIARHQRLREGKYFQTIEQPRHILEALSRMANPADSSVLLECMSNLVANEMFSGEDACLCTETALVNRISEEVRSLSKQVENLVVVTNNVFEDGILYKEMTMKYLRVLAGINQCMATAADCVVEVVVGIPVVLKGLVQRSGGRNKNVGH